MSVIIKKKSFVSKIGAKIVFTHVNIRRKVFASVEKVGFLSAGPVGGALGV